ncbi:hypothetical protein PR048_001744 [Dryococelus australis]|uniref:Uncharacterized protein n=1 Tax=Dryococelus australis TaxID=614101 RepID=A0ABQ9II78_9NEOP|nr:hypothetical protein PR048_001744 [Dryococelus australis]
MLVRYLINAFVIFLVNTATKQINLATSDKAQEASYLVSEITKNMLLHSAGEVTFIPACCSIIYVDPEYKIKIQKIPLTDNTVS